MQYASRDVKLGVSIILTSFTEEQADTHHQQSKKNDPTAPDVCFPPVILLSLRAKHCIRQV